MVNVEAEPKTLSVIQDPPPRLLKEQRLRRSKYPQWTKHLHLLRQSKVMLMLPVEGASPAEMSGSTCCCEEGNSQKSVSDPPLLNEE